MVDQRVTNNNVIQRITKLITIIKHLQIKNIKQIYKTKLNKNANPKLMAHRVI